VLNECGLPGQIATPLLGDRVIIRSLTVEEGRIVLEMLAHGPDASLPSRRTWPLASPPTAAGPQQTR